MDEDSIKKLSTGEKTGKKAQKSAKKHKIAKNYLLKCGRIIAPPINS